MENLQFEARVFMKDEYFFVKLFEKNSMNEVLIAFECLGQTKLLEGAITNHNEALISVHYTKNKMNDDQVKIFYVSNGKVVECEVDILEPRKK